MIDTIDIELKREDCGGVNLLTDIPCYLTQVINEGKSIYGSYLTGYLGNLKISINEYRLKISESSLCKYYLGDNFQTLTRGDIYLSFQKISDDLHLPLNKATIKRIDLAQNIILKYPENIYYPYLGTCQHYKRLEQPSGLYYSNSKRQLVFYSKVTEQQKKGVTIPELYKGRNLLRYEIRFKNRLQKQFNKSIITVPLLYDENFYHNLVKRWKNEYFSINKVNSKLHYMKPTGSIKEFYKQTALILINEVGQSKVIDMINEWQSMSHINKKQAFDIRKQIRELCKYNYKDCSNELISELDTKIKQVARYN